ncbi:UV DNA damage repair endonuclease UvsE [Clostridium perfringens]|uniref:UV DNA damage repair endonuclease UvsE n=1 Tax=Clostridium perfringens TaxID=1502 RepID=UPI000D7103F3|nr:UV DNA damage repair endonuclease UvsE [Clostridium perfringens]MBO3318026.1 UV DNA damage repair endonuclease UvsE [Clostridium perfringens]PWX21053.1 UV DNA damage repair endonuclease UvsE [Clostridium perfringens]
MKIGYACTPITTNARTNRRILLKDFSKDKFLSITKQNLDDLQKILEWNIKNNIYLFRIGSDIIPLGSHEINNISWQKEFKYELETIGTFIKNNKIRVSMHPGQYTVINTPKEDVLYKSIKDIEYHCEFLDSLNVDYKNKIILHIGGVYGDKKLAKENFLKGFKKLSDSSKKRLVIENDERNFSLDDVLDISSKLNIPVIFDNLHNICYGDNSYSLKEIYSLIIKTWNKELDGNMKVHYSEQDIFKKKGSHSPSISINSFLEYYEEVKEFSPDIMLEVKDKDVSAIKCINSLKEINKTLNSKAYREEIENYKLLLLQYDKDFQKNLNSFSKGLIEFYNYLDNLLLSPKDIIGFKYSLELAFNILKDHISNRESLYFKKLINEKEYEKAKVYLTKLVKKIEFPPKKLSYYISQP